jgi:retron-type reverse transcriptase
MRRSLLLSQIARSFLAGEPSPEQIVARCTRAMGKSWRWLPGLAKRYADHFARKTRPREREVVEFLRNDRKFQKVWLKLSLGWSIEQWITEPQKMQPVAAALGWQLPAIESVGALGEWLSLNAGDLEWFADLCGLAHQGSPQLSHYNYRVLDKRSGLRLIEAPKTRLKKLQRQILSQILERVPSHPSVHGFIKGRSILSCVAPHVGQRVILGMDLQDFFPSFAARRIQALFRTLGYPESVADRLGGICTTVTPRGVWSRDKFDPHLAWLERQHARDLYCRPHLPQGAPTSPAIANICFYKTDCRLDGLARSCGATYTRYADDLAFSGGRAFERGIERFSIHVAAILLEEGFHVNHRKTRVMRQGVRQHVVGLVANQHPNIIRSDFERLKATLTNCVRLGPASQNRIAHPEFRSHLEGRVGFVETVNAAKGMRLRRLFDQIPW